MGMVSPFAIRLRTRTVATIGNVAGALYAFSTLGSIAGTLLASFILFTLWPVPTIVHALGVALLVSAVLWGLNRRQLLQAGVTATVTILLAGIAGLRSPPVEGDGLQ